MTRRPTGRPTRRAAGAWAAACAALAAAGCGTGASERATVATIELSAAAISVVAGADAPLTARLLDAGGAELHGRAVVWTSRDPSIADVAPSSATTGVVRGRAPGTTQVSANVEGRSAVATVAVAPRPVATVDVQPTTLDLRVGATARLQARALDALGAELPGRAIAYASSDDRVATITAAGVVTAVAPGGATITVTSEQRTARVAVTVTLAPIASVSIVAAAPPLYVGGTAQLSVAAVDSAGRPASDRPVAWSSSDASVAGVSSTGLVTGLAVGTATITATIEGRSGTLAVAVLPRPVAAVALALAPLAVGDTARLTTRLADAQGRVLTGRAITFASDAPAVATVDALGLVTAVGAGTATLSATSEGVRGTLAVTVAARPVTTVDVAPDTARLGVGATVQLTATPRAANGAVVAGRTIAWTSGAPSVASVAPDGRATAIAPGTAVVFAQVDGVVGRAVLVVQASPVRTVVVAPHGATVRVGGVVDLAATTLDAAGAPLPGRVVTWTSSDASVAPVSSAGRVVALRVGTVTVTATSEGVSDVATVTVIP